MIIDLKQLSNKNIQTTTTSKKMSLSDSSTAFIFQMFINNKYSNPIGSIVREITSNCFDSHVESNSDMPVVIRKEFDEDANQYTISFIDYGVGLSPERVDKIYGVLFESTKRADNNQIGGFGIGSKSPLAYKRKIGFGSNEYDNSFFVITVHNGIKYYYCIFEGEEYPEINLLYQEETDERNGTEVKIPVLKSDIGRFESEIIRQLYYFENLVFEGFEDNPNITNKYNILKTQTFLYRGRDYLKSVHVCLGRVAYKIDYNVLDLNESEFYIPVALKFDIGELGVTDSREGIDYSEKTIKTIKDRLIALKKEFIDLLSKQFDNVVTLEDYFKSQKSRLLLNLTSDISIDLNCMIKDIDNIKYKNFKYSGFSHVPNDEQLFGLFFNTTIMGSKETRYERRNNSMFSRNYDTISKATNIYYLEEEYKRNTLKLGYMKSIHPRYYILRKNEFINEQSVQKIFKNPLLSIADVQEIIDEYWKIVKKYAKNYTDVTVPDTFRAEKRKRNRLIGEINIYIVSNTNGVCMRKVKIQDILNFNGKIFYGTKDDEDELVSAASLIEGGLGMLMVKDHNYGDFVNTQNKTNSNHRLMFCYTAKTNIKYFEEKQNAWKIADVNAKLLYRYEDKIKHKLSVVKLYNIFGSRYEANRILTAEKFMSLYPNAEKTLRFCKNIAIEYDKISSLGFVNSYDESYLKDYDFLKDGLVEAQKFCEIFNYFKNFMQYIKVPYYPDNYDYPEFYQMFKMIGDNCNLLK